MNLKSLTDSQLLEDTQNLVNADQALAAKVLHHLAEIERRRLYSALGYPSLFEYAVDKLGYSKADAYKHISAMQVIQEMPEVEEKLTDGRVSLSHMTLAQTLFRRELKLHGKKIPTSEKIALISSFEGKTTRQVEKAVMALASSPSCLMHDRLRPIGNDAAEIRFAANQEIIQKITQLRGLLAHKDPHISLGELFEKLCDLGIQSWSPQFAKPTKRAKTPTNTIALRSRHEVWQRDQGQCTQCGSMYMLEIDHIQSRALGGSNDKTNLRLLCRPCNQRHAIEVFGTEVVEAGRLDRSK